MTHVILGDSHVHHFAMSVPDLDVALAWYREVFGLEVEHRMDAPGIPARGAFMSRPGLRFEIWQTIPGSVVPEHRRTPNEDLHEGGAKHLAFKVPRLADRLPLLLERGVQIVSTMRSRHEPMRPDPDPCDRERPPVFAAFIQDPFGALIELIDEDQVGDGV